MNNALRLGKSTLTVAVVVATILWSIGIAFLVPFTVEAATLNAGDLIKSPSNSAVYYYGEDTKRHTFPTLGVYQSWYGNDFSKVKVISETELGAILIGKNATYRPGVKLVKVTTDPKVYAVEKNGSLRWVETEAVASALFGSDWSKQVTDLPDALFAADYGIAPTSVKAAADYDKTAAMNASPSISVDKGLGTAAPAAPAPTTPAPVAGDKAKMTRLAVTRSGLSTNARVTGVTLWDGTTQLGTTATLNASNQAAFTGLSVDVGVAGAGGAVAVALDPTSPGAASVTYLAANAVAMKLKIGDKVLTVAFNVAAAGAGEVLIFSVAAATDITLTGGTPTGTFPITSAGMSISGVTIGTFTLNAGPSTPGANTGIRPDETDRLVAQWRGTAGATEGATVRQLTVLRTGTASDSAVTKVTLKNDTTGAVLGSGTFTNGRLAFNINVPIAKGENVLFGVYYDMNQSNASSNQTIGAEIHDGVTYLVQVVGVVYGFGITPTRAGGCDTTGGTGGACTLQTVSAPTLRVEKSSQTPATGNIAAGKTGVLAAAYDFVVSGGSVTVSRMSLLLTPVGAASQAAYITNIVFADKDGKVVAGPQDGTTTTAATAQTLVYTDTITFPVGTTTLFVKYNTSSSAANNQTYTVAVVDPSNTITANSMTVRETLTAKSVTAGTVNNVAANTLTIKGATFALVTDAAPIAGTIVRNTQNFTFAIGVMDATAGGEDGKVASVTVTDTIGAGAALTDLLNLSVWGDADNTDTDNTIARLETSNSTATNAATTTFTFSKPLRVSNKATSKLYFKATVSSSASVGATATHLFVFTAAVATGYGTGGDITETYSGAGQAQTLQTSGTLKVELASDTPPAAQFAAGSSGVPAVKYKLTAGREGADVTEFTIALGREAAQLGTAATAGDISAVKVKFNGAIIGSTNGYPFNTNGFVTVTLPSGTLVLAKDVAGYLVLEVDFYVKEQATSGRVVRLGLGDSAGTTGATYASEWETAGATGAAGSYSIVATGKESGQTITATNIDSIGDGNGNVAGGNTSFLYDGVLVVSLNATSPSGLKTPGTGSEVFRADLTANGDEIIAYDIEFLFSGSGTMTGTGTASLKSADGSVTYATWTNADLGVVFELADVHITTAVSATRDSTTTPVVISVAAGATLSLKLEGDTTGNATNTSFQASIGDGTALTSGVAWQDAQIAALDGTCTTVAGGATADLGAECAVDSTLTKNLPVNGKGLSY